MTCSSSGELVATGIPTHHAHIAWPQIWPLIKPAYEKSREKTDLLAGIVSNNLQAWAVYEHTIPVAGIVSRLLRPEGTSSLNCRLWLVGGSRLSEWAPDFITKLIPWAKAEGCDRISGAGRKGWTRIVTQFGGKRVSDEDGEPCWELRI
jgi:hypothetical protein